MKVLTSYDVTIQPSLDIYMWATPPLTRHKRTSKTSWERESRHIHKQRPSSYGGPPSYFSALNNARPLDFRTKPVIWEKKRIPIKTFDNSWLLWARLVLARVVMSSFITVNREETSLTSRKGSLCPRLLCRCLHWLFQRADFSLFFSSACVKPVGIVVKKTERSVIFWIFSRDTKKTIVNPCRRH